MTREDAKELARIGAYKKTNFELLMKGDYDLFVDKIYNDFEKQQLEKDKELEKSYSTIERLTESARGLISEGLEKNNELDFLKLQLKIKDEQLLKKDKLIDKILGAGE